MSFSTIAVKLRLIMSKTKKRSEKFRLIFLKVVVNNTRYFWRKPFYII